MDESTMTMLREGVHHMDIGHHAGEQPLIRHTLIHLHTHSITCPHTHIYQGFIILSFRKNPLIAKI